MRQALVAFAVAMSLVITVPAHADAPTGLEGLLALKPSPGAEALLLPYATDPRVPQRWRDALADSDPQRRAAAARMIGVARVRTLLGGVMNAARNERHPAVLAEVLRTLVIIGSEHSDTVIVQRLPEVSGIAQQRIVTTIAALRPTVLLPLVAQPGAFGTSPTLVGAAYGGILRSAPDHASALEREIAARGTQLAIAALIREAAARGRVVPADVVLAAARGNANTALALLDWLARVPGAPARVQEDAALVKDYQALRQTMLPDDPQHTLELALLDRWFGRANAAAPDIAAAPQGPSNWWQISPTAFVVLAAGERKALAARLAAPPHLKKAIEDARIAKVRPRAEIALGEAYMLSDVPASLLADLRTVTGCASEPEPGDRPAAIVYGPTGRAQQATLGDPALSPACNRYARTLIAVAYGDATPSVAGAQATRTILRLDGAWVSCLAEAQSSVGALLSTEPALDAPAAGTLRPPRKLQDRRPVYPGAALERRVEGVVVIEAIISPGGCVAEAKVRQSIPLLDFAALQAVSYWRYSPMLLDGKPVPVVMMITVNFAL